MSNFIKSYFCKCFVLFVFLFKLCGCYSTCGALQSAKTLGKGESYGTAAFEISCWISEPDSGPPEKLPPDFYVVRTNIRYGIGQKTDLGLYLNTNNLFAILLSPSLVLVEHQFYLKQRITPETAKIALSGMFGITGPVYNVEKEKWNLFIPRTTMIISSNNVERSDFYGGVGCTYGPLYCIRYGEPWDFQYIEDSNFRFIPDIFLGWEGNFLLEVAVTFYRNKPLYLHLSFGWPH